MKIYITNNSLYLVGPIQEVLQKLRTMSEQDLLLKEKLKKLLH